MKQKIFKALAFLFWIPCKWQQPVKGKRILLIGRVMNLPMVVQAWYDPANEYCCVQIAETPFNAITNVTHWRQLPRCLRRFRTAENKFLRY